MTEASYEKMKHIGAVAAAAASLLTGLAYLVRHLQFGLYGLPFENESLAQIYLFATGLVLLVLLAFLLVCGPLLAIAWPVHRFLSRFPFLTHRALLPMTLVTLLVVLLPPMIEMGDIKGVLWRDPAALGGLAPLLLHKSYTARLILGGLATGATALAWLPLVPLLKDWHDGGEAPPLRRLLSLGGLVGLALCAFPPLLALAMPAPGDLMPRVSVQTRLPNAVPIEGYLLSWGEPGLILLPTDKSAFGPVVLSRRANARVDYLGDGVRLSSLLSSRWESRQETLIQIAGVSFGAWAGVSALLITLTFALTCFRSPAVAAAVPAAPSSAHPG